MSCMFHSADLHLRDSANASLARGLDFYQSAMQLLTAANLHNAKAVTIAGDLFDKKKLSSLTVTQARKLHDMAIQFDLPVYVITGNHEMSDPPWTSIFGNPEAKSGFICADYLTFEVEGVRFKGLPFLSREELLAELDKPEEFDVLLWHGQVKEFCGFPVEGAVELADFDRGKFKTAWLGDIHQWDWRRTPGGRLVGYPGSTELGNKDEPLKKYVAKMDLQQLDKEPEQITLQTRPVHVFRISTDEDLSRILAELDAAKGIWHKPPLVFVAYNPEIEGVIARIKNVLPAEAITRYAAYGGAQLPVSEFGVKAVDKGAEILDLIEMFIPRNSSIFELVRRLADPDVNPKDELATFVMTRLQPQPESL